MDALPIAALAPEEAGNLFGDFAQPWWIAGGWALDLFLGRETREHSDIEIALFREDQVALRAHLSDWELRYALDQQLHDWPDGLRLDLPIHELWARRQGQSAWQFELLLNERIGDEWCFRRDTRVRRPVTEVGAVTESGLPALAPEIVLLYKAANPQPKDRSDFSAVIPSLGDQRSRWLTAALALAYPGHAWL